MAAQNGHEPAPARAGKPELEAMLRNAGGAAVVPPGDPERMRRVAELVGQSIRSSCAESGRTVMALVADAEKILAAIRGDAEVFVASLEEIGDAHATRLDAALAAFNTVTETIAGERKRMAALLAIETGGARTTVEQ